MMCDKAEIELYLSSLGSKSIVRISRDCNQFSWAPGCQSGWACSTPDANSFANNSFENPVPSRAENCRPCCPGFFCPHGLTCMMRKCFFPTKLPLETNLMMHAINSIIFLPGKKHYIPQVPIHQSFQSFFLHFFFCWYSIFSMLCLLALNPFFFCPACPLGAYCPLGTLNKTTNLCDP